MTPELLKRISDLLKEAEIKAHIRLLYEQSYQQHDRR